MLKEPRNSLLNVQGIYTAIKTHYFNESTNKLFMPIVSMKLQERKVNLNTFLPTLISAL